ncbi:MAG: hypothetical protein PVI78_00645 [Anaerolineales bacterium]
MGSKTVEAHSGYTYGERPVALYWEGSRLQIAEVEARWRVPSGNGFRVRTEDNRVFELYYDRSSDEWRITQP